MPDEIAIENHDQALAHFLWNEQERHRDDIEAIIRDLDAPKRKWKVIPRLRRVYAKV